MQHETHRCTSLAADEFVKQDMSALNEQDRKHPASFSTFRQGCFHLSGEDSSLVPRKFTHGGFVGVSTRAPKCVSLTAGRLSGMFLARMIPPVPQSA